jgi:DNA invertase Pin-like site-specific DNA recombinase
LPLPAKGRLVPCAIYTRQSVKSESNLTSCEVQRQFCLDFVTSQKNGPLQLVALPDHFDDQGRSGADLERPALQRILRLIEKGALKAVIVHRLDRLSRRMFDCARLLDQFKQHGVRLFIAAMPELSAGAHDMLMLNMLAVFAEFERDMIRERIRDKRAGLIARNQRIAGVTPYGYGADSRTKQLTPIPEEAAVVRELFESVAAGIPPSEVAALAAGRGWRTRSGRFWSARQILGTVSNPVYLGRFRAGRGSRPGVHPAIVDEALFDGCAVAMQSRRRPRTNSRFRYLPQILSRKIRCLKCGQLMNVRSTRKGPVVSTFFRCQRVEAGERPCRGTQVRAYDIELAVRSALLEPATAFPKKRGRPSRAVVNLYSLAEVIPLLNPVQARALIRGVVNEVIWNADTGGIRIKLNWETLAGDVRELLGEEPQ